MSNEPVTVNQTLGISLDTIDLRLRQELAMDSQENESSAGDLTLRSVDERMKQATDLILWRVEEICALLASLAELEPAGNSEASGSRWDNASTSPLHNQHDSDHLICHPSFVWNCINS